MPKAVIVGAGIAGLATGIALRQHGWTVEIREQAPEIAEVGAGIQISPNGVKVLDVLGVLPLLEPILFEPEAAEIRQGRSNRRLLTLPLKAVAQQRWGARYISVHRADLIEALRVRFDGELRLGAAADGIPTGDHDLVVGADGIHSTIRAALFGPDTPVFTGNVAWRGLVPAAALGALAPPPHTCIWTGEGRHAVTTYVRSGALVNFVALVEQDDWQEEGWSIPGERRDAQRLFGDWNPTLDAIIANAPSLNRWALFARDPLPRWSQGKTVLVGDAAHPMLPSMAQAGCQALEDAFVLARCLSGVDSVEAGCAHYFQQRIARATRVQAKSCANARLFHHRSALAKFTAYGPIWAAGRIAPSLGHRRYDWIYGTDVTL